MKWLPICLLISISTSAQDETRYKQVDEYIRSVVRPINTLEELDSLVSDISLNFNSDEERVRGIFVWLSDHLSYDCESVNDDKLRPVSLREALLTKKSVCSGFSGLLNYCCRKLGIESATITGVAKTAKSDLLWNGHGAKTNHSWNAVKINGEWKLLDATWAAGAADEDCKTVTRQFEGFYFFAPPEKLILVHYPNDSSWQLLHPLISREQFIRWPVFQDPFFHANINSFMPDSGNLVLQRNEVIEFRFSTKTVLSSITVWSEDNKMLKPEFGNFVRKVDEYSYRYKVTQPGNYYLSVALDGKRSAMHYRVWVK